MSGRHKPLMHVIFLFSPAISPAFPHRSLLFPNHFKNGMYFCLKPHALSLLIRGVRFHWDSMHASSLNKLDIPFSPARGCLLTNQVCLGVGTPRLSFREDWREVIDWLQPRANSWVHLQWISYPVSLDAVLGWGAAMQSWLCSSHSLWGSLLPSTEGSLLHKTC